MTLLLSTQPDYPAEKYCNGCKRWLSVEKFGVRSSIKSELSPRCMECNAEASRKYYSENFDRISERKKQYWARDHPPKQKHTFIKLEMCVDPAAILRKCPHCGYRVSVMPGQNEGFCGKTGKKYLVKRHLSTVKLEAEFKIRDYEGEILNFIRSKGRTYAAEIGKNINVSRVKVANVLNDLVEAGILVENRQKFRWVEINNR